MARYKYSENNTEAVDIHFDTETHGEYMGMEQGGVMKKVATSRLKERLLGEVVLGIDWQQEVLTIVATPPVSPTEGDRYIVGYSATGEWEEYDDYIAEYVNSEWEFLAPQERMGLFLYNDLLLVIYKDGQWEQLLSLDEITEVLNEVKGYRDEILDDPGFQAVSSDLLGDNDIGTVADALTIITAVANNEGNINAVALNKTNIDTVAGLNLAIIALAERKVQIDALYAQLPTIALKANKDYVDQELDDTRGVGWNNTTIMDILAQYAMANGLATLDGEGKVYLSQIPSLPMMDVHVVASDNDMLALTANKGDVAIRTDLPSVFILSSEDPTELTDWIELTDLQGAIDSALILIKGVGWNGETIKETADEIKAHKLSEAPHIFKNLKTGKEYEFGFQVSSEGHPQIIYKEI